MQSHAGFFTRQKSLREWVVDTFNYYYERSPVTLSSFTGYHHPRIPRLIGNPIFGHALTVTSSADGIANLFEKLAKLATAENNPRGMAYSTLTVVPSILITRPTDIAQVLKHNEAKVYRGIPALNEIFEHGNLFTIPSGPEWREKRNQLRRWIFDDKALTELAPKMQEIIDEHIAQLKINGNVDSLEEFLVSLTMNVFARTALGSGPLGESVKPISDGLGKAIDAGSDPFNNVLAKLVTVVNYFRQYYHFETRLEVEKHKLKNILEEHFFKPQLDNLKTMEGLLKDYFDKNPNREDTAFREAYSEAALYLLAGQETTERLLQFTLLLLNKHPQVLAELRKEITRINPDNKPWTKKLLDEMHYLGKVIKEVLRLYPPIPIIPRITSEALVLADIPLCNTPKEYEEAMANRDTTKDIILPRGTAINIMPWVTQRLASLYENPLEFKPERHLTDSVSVNGDDNSKSYAFITFGAGSRDCPGRLFAIQEAKLAIIGFILKFDFKTSLDDKELKTYIRGNLKLHDEVSATFTPRR